ncbi:MAG: VOC family protein [Rhodobacter sp.]|nr:VOC family protein [Rhodobacter sp.]
MTEGHFIWTDLSTFDMATARADYGALFGWTFRGDEAYDFAGIGEVPSAAIFPMPAKLTEIGMPSFWMSYVQVKDLDAVVDRARSHDGAIVEIEPQAFDDDARIALVRDPSGAGFTLYEGPGIAAAAGGAGTVVARYHHLPDVGLIEAFYRDLFGWTFHKAHEKPWRVFDIRHPDGTLVAQAEEVPEAVRGKFRYWMPCFAVSSVASASDTLAEHGGTLASDLQDGRVVVADRQGAHFMIRAMDRETAGEPSSRAAAPFAWKALIGLVCIWLAVVLELQAFWGVLFLIWTWPAIRSGRADFIEPVTRATQPLVYWGLVLTWVVLSVWLIAAPLMGGR